MLPSAFETCTTCTMTVPALDCVGEADDVPLATAFTAELDVAMCVADDSLLPPL